MPCMHVITQVLDHLWSANFLYLKNSVVIFHLATVFLSKTLKVITSSDQNWLLVMTIHQFTNAVLVTWFRTSQTSQCLLMGTYIYFSALSCSAGWILPCLQDLHSFRSSPLHKKLIPPMHLYAQWGQAEEAEKLLVNLIPSNYYRL